MPLWLASNWVRCTCADGNRVVSEEPGGLEKLRRKTWISSCFGNSERPSGTIDSEPHAEFSPDWRLMGLDKGESSFRIPDM
jgi:hypothetical protein